MQSKARRIKVYREKYKGEWIAIYVEKVDPGLINVGCCIHKSKRAQNDWYAGKKNKRARATWSFRKNRDLKALHKAYAIFKKVLSNLDEHDTVMIYTTEGQRAKVIQKYCSRKGLGFEFTGAGEANYWFLLPESYVRLKCI